MRAAALRTAGAPRRWRWRCAPARAGAGLHEGADTRAGPHGARFALGFSAGGLLFPYYIGVLAHLRESVDRQDGGFRIAGASAGSLVAAVHFSGLDEAAVLARTKELYADLRAEGTAGRVASVLQRAMSDLLPEDVHERLQGRCYIAVTQLEPRVRPLLLDTFSSKDDLIGALLCSCFIPFWLDGRSAARRYRGAAHADGGFTNFLPVPPRRPEERLVRVSCFNTSAWPAFNDIEVRPGVSGRPPLVNGLERLRLAFTPGDDAVIDALVEEGRADARAWLEGGAAAGEAQAGEEQAGEAQASTGSDPKSSTR